MRPRRNLPTTLLLAMAGTAVLAFGMINIHKATDITEGGILGLVLLFDHWWGVPPSVSTILLNGILFAMGLKILGKRFLSVSIFATVTLAGFYLLFDLIPNIIPDLSSKLWLAAILGGLSVGIGTGLVVAAGGAASGDDALALIITHKTRLKLTYSYIISDVTVLLLSLTYIPISQITYSFFTVFLSSTLIGVIEHYLNRPSKKSQKYPPEVNEV